MARILLVDDERSLREGLKAVLAGEGFSVRTARDGAEALKIFDEGFDLVLLDVMMPKMNGFRTCEELRRRSPLVPVVFLTARDSDADEIRGLGLGADDYVSKSACEAVLLARIRGQLERARRRMMASPSLIPVGSAKVDFTRLEVVAADGAVTRLTKTEADILRMLAADRGRVFSNDELVEALRGAGYACEDGMIYSHISNLRRKLASSGGCIVNDRHAGYRLED
jgi:DNA-binding response OmpR family regulator